MNQADVMGLSFCAARPHVERAMTEEGKESARPGGGPAPGPAAAAVPARRRGWLRHLPLAVILLVAAAGAVVLRDQLGFETLRAHRAALLALREAHYGAMAALFVGFYILLVTFSLPGAAVASMAGGFLFGLAAGTALNVVAATIGATAIFLAARWGIGATLADRLENAGGAAARVRENLRRNEINVLLLMRLVPAVPFFVANLVPAMVGVSLRNFVWTTALGIIPGAIVYTWIGVGLGEVFDRGETPDLSLLREPHVLGPLAGLCLLVALPMAVRAIRDRRARG